MSTRGTIPLLTIAMLVVLLTSSTGAGPVRAQGEFPLIDFAEQTEIPPEEYAALVALYNATGGPNWETSWTLPTTSPCSLFGVDCTGGHVTWLYLPSNNLTGELPSELGDLQELTCLALYDNALTGDIPPELGTLSRLVELDLSVNQLSGEIPPELGNLSNLWNLYLGNNQLSGEIPPELGNLSNLWNLHLGANQLSGEIPPEWAGLSWLQSIYLYSNELSGPIPAWIDSWSNLRNLSLGDNHFTGTIPAALGNIPGLALISLFSNHLSGPIPAELGGLSQLYWLNLADNQLVGPIPPELAGQVDLTILDLDTNMLWADTDALDDFLAQDAFWAETQVVPPADVQATPLGGGLQLTWTPRSYFGDDGYYEVGMATTPGGPYTSTTHITDCEATGITISPLEPGGTYYLAVRTFRPSGWAQRNDLLSPWGEEVTVTALPGQSQLPDEEYAALEALYHAAGGAGWEVGWTLPTHMPCVPGVLPGVTCANGHVVALNLAGRGLAGTLPPELGNLTMLQTLDLSGNALSGEIPADLGNLASLMYLSLHDNQLEGPIPATLGDLSALRRLSLGNNRLSGPVPAELGALTSLYWLTLQDNQITGPLPAALADLENLSMLDLSYNALWAQEDALEAFLANDPDWVETQVAPPTNLRATALGGNAQLTWTPISYQTPGSYYEVGVSTTPGGPYTVVTRTTDAASAEATVTGLAPWATIYLAVRTNSPAAGPQHNDLLSRWGEEVAIRWILIPFAAR